MSLSFEAVLPALPNSQLSSTRTEALSSTRESADADANGVRAEVTSIYDEYASHLLRYALSVAKDEELAAECVQETFFRYFVFRTEGNEVRNARPWLFRVLHNSLIDAVRRRSNTSMLSLDMVSNYAASGQVHHEAEAANIRERLPELLSPRELECVHLRAEGLRYEEIGAVLKVQTSTVGAALTRATTKLRRVFRTPERIG